MRHLASEPAVAEQGGDVRVARKAPEPVVLPEEGFETGFVDRPIGSGGALDERRVGRRQFYAPRGDIDPQRGRDAVTSMSFPRGLSAVAQASEPKVSTILS